MSLIKAYITHKKSELYSDCQDSYAISTQNKAIAIADGVSQSLFPKVWADMLTEAYVSDMDFTLNDNEKVQTLRSRWKSYFVEELKRQQAANNPMVWKLENCFVEGKSAGATFAGLRFSENKTISYEILGDSCIVIIKDKKIQKLISSKEESDEFDNYPDYIDSSPNIGQKGNVKQGSFSFEKGMEILLVTDALSDLLNEICKSEEQEQDIIANLTENISDQKDFEEYIEELRDKGMSNDDTTLVHIRWSDLDRIEVVHQTQLSQYIEKEKQKSNSTDVNKVSDEIEYQECKDDEQQVADSKKESSDENSEHTNIILKIINNIFRKDDLSDIQSESEEEKYINDMIDNNRDKVVQLLREYLFGKKK